MKRHDGETRPCKKQEARATEALAETTRFGAALSRDPLITQDKFDPELGASTTAGRLHITHRTDGVEVLVVLPAWHA